MRPTEHDADHGKESEHSTRFRGIRSAKSSQAGELSLSSGPRQGGRCPISQIWMRRVREAQGHMVLPCILLRLFCLPRSVFLALLPRTLQK